MEKTRQTIPTARKDGLVIQEVEGELLVYDTKSHRAHCLNRTAALVWKYCDGEQALEEVARKVEAEIRVEVSSEVVRLAVKQLEKKKLLEAPAGAADGGVRISRRELARRLGIAAAAASLPLITSINAPAALQAASCAGVEESCGGANPPCCPGLLCFSGSCVNP